MFWIAMLATAVVLAALVALESRARIVDGTSRMLNLMSWALGLGMRALFMVLVQIAVPISLLHDTPLWFNIVVYVIAMDLGEYLFHRAQHAIPWLWQMHTLHHSDHDMNATTANRHFWGDAVLKSVTIWPLAALIVQPSAAALGVYAGLSLWNYVSHAGIRLDFGPWSWLVNSPAYHRRHHSTDPAHFGSNFAALFPIFDVLAGSYHRPDGYPATGLDERPTTLGDLALWPLRRSRLTTAPSALVQG